MELEDIQYDNLAQTTAQEIVEMIDGIIEEARSINIQGPTDYQEGFKEGATIYLELLKQDVIEDYELID